MKKKLFIAMCLTMVLSCTNEDSEEIIEEPLSLLESMIDNSPWTYDRFEVVSIVQANGYDLQQSQIDDFENESNQEFNGFTISFNDDGTGIDTDGEFNWEWVNEKNGEMRIWNDTYIISLNNSELVLGLQSFAFVPDGECCLEILYNGNIILK